MEYFLGPHKVLLIYQKLLSYFIFEPVCCFYGTFLIKTATACDRHESFFFCGYEPVCAGSLPGLHLPNAYKGKIHKSIRTLKLASKVLYKIYMCSICKTFDANFNFEDAGTQWVLNITWHRQGQNANINGYKTCQQDRVTHVPLCGDRRSVM